MIISTKTWETDDGIGCSGDSGLDTIRLDHLNITDLVCHPDDFVKNQSDRDGHSPRSVLLGVLWGVTAACANESVTVLSKNDDIVSDYLSSALKRLNDNEDTGLIYPGTYQGWLRLDDKEKDSVREHVDTLSDYFYDFPSIGSISVVSSTEPCVIELGSERMTSTIPLVSRTSTGLVSIVPVVDSEDEVSASLFSSTLNKDTFLYVENVNLWNLGEARISRGGQDAIMSVNTAISKL